MQSIILSIQLLEATKITIMATTSEEVNNYTFNLKFFSNSHFILQNVNKNSLPQRTIATNENGVIGSRPALVNLVQFI